MNRLAIFNSNTSHTGICGSNIIKVNQIAAAKKHWCLRNGCTLQLHTHTHLPTNTQTRISYEVYLSVCILCSAEKEKQKKNKSRHRFRRKLYTIFRNKTHAHRKYHIVCTSCEEIQWIFAHLFMSENVMLKRISTYTIHHPHAIYISYRKWKKKRNKKLFQISIVKQ